MYCGHSAQYSHLVHSCSVRSKSKRNNSRWFLIKDLAYFGHVKHAGPTEDYLTGSLRVVSFTQSVAQLIYRESENIEWASTHHLAERCCCPVSQHWHILSLEEGRPPCFGIGHGLRSIRGISVKKEKKKKSCHSPVPGPTLSSDSLCGFWLYWSVRTRTGRVDVKRTMQRAPQLLHRI